MARIVFIANNNIGAGLSGGDRIFSELLRAWAATDTLTLMGAAEAEALCHARGIAGHRFIETDARNAAPNPYTLAGMARHVARRTRRGLRATVAHAAIWTDTDAIYSVSDAWPDCLPAWRLKRRFPALRWIAGYYLFIPPPWARENPYRGGQRARGLAYWLLQRVTYPLVRRDADVVYVTSQPDVAPFARPGRPVVVVRGGVDVAAANAACAAEGLAPFEARTYDACFIGRLHYQKGVRELIPIWRRVADRRPGARLAIIGDGPLGDEVRALIAAHGLTAQVVLLGFRDGPAKFDIFRDSRIVVHPAIYDSGGMAAAEAMAWGLPGVAFDLEALRTYYPRGMVKAPPGDLDAFAAAILRLLEDRAHYTEQSRAARDLILREWEWGARARQIRAETFGAPPSA